MAAPASLSTLRLRAINPQRGLVVGAFETEDSDPEAPSYGLSTLVVSSAGTMLSGNATLVEECDPIVWIEVVPLSNGAFVSWAEDLGDHAELFAAVVNLDGHRQTDVLPLHANAAAWQLVRHDKGAMLGVVTSDGNVDFVTISAQGEPAQPKNLVDDHTAELDIDLAAAGDRVLIAFSDRRNVEPQLHSAWVSLDGSLQSNVQPVTKPFGASTLIGLRSTPSGPVLLWQNTTQEPDLVRIGRINGEGRLTDESLALALPPPLESAQPHDLLVPQLETTATGVVVMQPPCAASRDCKKHADVLELGPELKPQSRLAWSERAGADLVWDFQCGPVNCAALAANFGSRTQIQLLTTTAASRTAIDTHKASDTAATSINGSIRALLSIDELAGLAATRVGRNAVVTTLTAFDPNTPYEVPTAPAPDGRLAPVQAQLTTYVVGTREAANPGSPQSTSLSIRARSVAGVDVTSAGSEALVVWTAIDNQKPQLFLTSIDENGHKIRQSMLTRQNGEVLALGADTAKDKSYYVGWVREEGKSNKAYAAHVNPNLTRQSADTLIAETTGTISNVDIVVTTTGVWAVLALGNEGTETLKWLRLNAATLQAHKGAVTNPFDLDASKAATDDVARFAPRLTRWNDGMALAWLSRGSKGATAQLVHLDAKGDVVRRYSAAVPGEPATLDLDCDVDCRIAVTGELEDAQGYVALAHLPANAPEQFALTAEVVSRRLSPAASQVRAAVSLSDVYYFDAEPGAERGQVRAVEWSPRQ